MSALIAGVDFIYIFVKDFERAIDFYENKLSLPCTVRYKRIDGAEFDAGNLTFVVVACEPLGIEFKPSIHPIALHVDDVTVAQAYLEGKGVAFRHSLDSGVCQMAFFDDPDGNALVLHNRYAPEDED